MRSSCSERCAGGLAKNIIPFVRTSAPQANPFEIYLFVIAQWMGLQQRPSHETVV